MAILLEIIGPFLSIILMIALLLQIDRLRRKRRYKKTGVKSYIASLRASQWRGTRTSSSDVILRGDLLVDADTLAWEPRTYLARRGVTGITIRRQDVVGYHIKRMRSFVPAFRLRIEQKDGRSLQLMIADPRDLRAVLRQNGDETAKST